MKLVDLERATIAREGIVVLFQRGKDVTAIGMQIGVRGNLDNRLVVTGERVLVPPQLAQQLGPVADGPNVIRLERQRAVLVENGVLPPLKRAESIRQGIVSETGMTDDPIAISIRGPSKTY